MALHRLLDAAAGTLRRKKPAILRGNHQKTPGTAEVRLTEKGHSQIKRWGLNKFSGFAKFVSPTTLHHKILTASVGLLIERNFDLSIGTERELYSRYMRRRRAGEYTGAPMMPDLILRAQPKDIPIEIELNQKTDERYRTLWSRYEYASEGTVLYLVPSRERRDGLLRLSRHFYKECIYAAELSVFRETLGRVSFLNFNGRSYELSRAREACQMEPPTAEPGGIPALACWAIAALKLI